MNTKGKWTNEALEDAMDVVENGTTSLKNQVGTKTYILFHCLITCMGKKNLRNLGQRVC